MVSVKKLIKSGRDAQFAARVLMSFSRSVFTIEDYSHTLSRQERIMPGSKSAQECDQGIIQEDDDVSTDEEGAPKRIRCEQAKLNHRNEDPGPMPPPEMPENVRGVINAMGGVNIHLIIQKRLNATDMGGQQNSLAIPFGQLFNGSHEFLTNAERVYLSRKYKKGKCNGIGTRLLDTRPVLWDKEVPFKKWVMKKGSGARSDKYVLCEQWKKIVESNGLRASNVIQIWAFRVDDRLHLALVKVDEE